MSRPQFRKVERSPDDEQDDVYYEEHPGQPQDSVYYYEENPQAQEEGGIYYYEESNAQHSHQQEELVEFYEHPDYENNPIQRALDQPHYPNGYNRNSGSGSTGEEGVDYGGTYYNVQETNPSISDDEDNPEHDYKNINKELANYQNSGCWLSNEDEVPEDEDDPDYVNNPANFPQNEDEDDEGEGDYLKPDINLGDAFIAKYPIPEKSPTGLPVALGHQYFPSPADDGIGDIPTRRAPPPPPEPVNNMEGMPTRRQPPPLPQQTQAHQEDSRRSSLGKETQKYPNSNAKRWSGGSQDLNNGRRSSGDQFNSPLQDQPQNSSTGQRNVVERTPSDGGLYGAKSGNIVPYNKENTRSPTVSDVINSLNKAPGSGLGVGKAPPGQGAICVFPGMKPPPQLMSQQPPPPQLMPQQPPPPSPQQRRDRPVPVPRPRPQDNRNPSASETFNPSPRKVPNPPASISSIENLRLGPGSGATNYPKTKDPRMKRVPSDEKPPPPSLASMPRRPSLPENRPLPDPPRAQKIRTLPVTQAPNTKKRDDLQRSEWYHARASRKDAEHKLLNLGREGAFLVRPSRDGPESSNPYALSVFYKKRVWHFHVRRRSDMKMALGKQKPEEPAFDTVQDLIWYHKLTVLEFVEQGRKCGQTLLKDSPRK